MLDTKSIKSRRESELYKYFVYGEQYYKARNTAITEREKKVFIDGIGVVSNPFGADYKTPSGDFKKIVDQKVLYQLGNGVVFEEDQTLDDYFSDTFDEVIIDLGLDVSKKAESWLLAYKDNGKLKFTQIPAEQITPVYDEYNKMVSVYRSFKKDDIDWVYEYTDKEIIRYQKKSKNKNYEEFDTIGHYTVYNEFSGQMVGEPEEHHFTSIPLIPLYNNREHLSDLYNIKAFIDVYDVIMSDFANNIDDMQDAFFTLKGYTGDTQHLGEFMRQLKQFKAVPVSEDGDVTSHQLNIPTEARSTLIDLLERAIYRYSMAVDLSKIQGGSLTNVLIKAMFADLDLKCNQFESELRKFIKKLITFINENDNKSFSYDCSFVREMIVNTSETVENVIKMSGLVSDKTRREILPYDIDIDQEEERMAEQEGDIKLGGE